MSASPSLTAGTWNAQSVSNRTEDHTVPALEGVIVALLTPVDREGKVDHGALRQLVERVTSRGVAGVSPLGSTGEGYSLGLDQRLAVGETVGRAGPAGRP